MIDNINLLGYIPKDALNTITNNPVDDSVFEMSLDAAINLLNTTQTAENLTTALTYDFMTGKDDNIHNLMIASQKSSTLLSFTMQVRNQLMTAYNDIIKLPV
ncbi:MAG: flagellar hook-basal body complex protein FliE [Epulopiscium sp. Nuni2H_MBin003]|nr:MAG: flagellar hook-basal body complex protein FliE [Epulopiscium sp. Nuni2H_MBin003]